MPTVLIWLDFFGVVVFAASGSLRAGRKRMDVFGVVVLAAVTALGGGTLRDLVLGARPVFWIAAPSYLIAAVAAGIITFIVLRIWTPPARLLSVADAFGLAVFTVVGAQTALGHGALALIAVIMGVMTAVAGGMLRDVLAGESPLILSHEIYATASLLGAIAFVAAAVGLKAPGAGAAVSIALTLGLRLAAIRWRLSLPILVAREGRGGNTKPD